MLRNKEFLRFSAFFIIISIALAAFGFWLGPAAGMLALACAVLFGTSFLVFTSARYKRIARIAEQIDLVLHREDHLWHEEPEEGELSVLYDEIMKMSLRIREQNAALRREKEHLADSLADIAHQLRTPLTSANLILSLITDKTDENERRMLAREAEELLVRMDWLLTSLLKLSRLDAGVAAFQNERVEANSLLRAALQPLLIPLELRGITLQTNVPENMYIQCDYGWLAEALQNILKNCMENAGEGGEISIACSDTPLFCEIVIHDSGAGFAKEALSHLFDRFYRGQNDDKAGYGIGLALCRMIVMRMSGTVSAKNHPQGGAMFCVRFPK